MSDLKTEHHWSQLESFGPVLINAKKEKDFFWTEICGLRVESSLSQRWLIWSHYDSQPYHCSTAFFWLPREGDKDADGMVEAEYLHPFCAGFQGSINSCSCSVQWMHGRKLTKHPMMVIPIRDLFLFQVTNRVSPTFKDSRKTPSVVTSKRSIRKPQKQQLPKARWRIVIFPDFWRIFGCDFW